VERLFRSPRPWGVSTLVTYSSPLGTSTWLPTLGNDRSSVRAPVQREGRSRPTVITPKCKRSRPTLFVPSSEGGRGKHIAHAAFKIALRSRIESAILQPGGKSLKIVGVFSLKQGEGVKPVPVLREPFRMVEVPLSAQPSLLHWPCSTLYCPHAPPAMHRLLTSQTPPDHVGI